MSIRYFISEIGHWLSTFFVLGYTIGFVIRWVQNHRVSRGHFLIGMIVSFISFMLLIVVARWPDYAHPFGVLTLGASGVWLWYNNWYFDRYPMGDFYDEPYPKTVAIGKDTAVGRFLTQPGEAISLFTAPTAKRAGIVAIILFVAGYGFMRVVDSIAAGDRRVIAATRKADSTARVVKHEVAVVIGRAVDTLRDQRTADSRVDSAFRAQTLQYQARGLANQRQVLNNQAAVKRTLGRVNRNQQDMPRPIYPPYVTPMRPNPTTGLLPTSKVRPVPVSQPPHRQGRKGRGLGWVEERADSSQYYVLSNDLPQP